MSSTQNIAIRPTVLTSGNEIGFLETEFLPPPVAQPNDNGFSTAQDVLINPRIFAVNFCISRLGLLSHSQYKNKPCSGVKGLSTLRNSTLEKVNNRPLLKKKTSQYKFIFKYMAKL